MTEASTRILVVEDDPTVAEVVSRYLTREGYTVESVRDGRGALARASTRMPDLVVLDLMLPGLDGLEVCRRLRALAPVPVIMLTAKREPGDRIIGLELGADDYVGKPFSPRELVARVRSVLRRAHAEPLSDAELAGTPLRAGRLELDVRARQLRVGDQVVSLRVREYELLAFLMRHPGEVFRREALLENVWGYAFGDTSTVTVHVRRLREKIERDPSNPELLCTVWGVGYRFATSPALAHDGVTGVGA